MPRPGPRRPLVAIRISAEGVAAIDKAAEARGVNRSEQVRIMLAYALTHMPKNWQPADPLTYPAMMCHHRR